MAADLTTRIDDAILIECRTLARVRNQTLRGSIHDFQSSCRQAARLSEGLPDEAIWRTRIDRCDVLLAEPSDEILRRRALEAVERDR